MNQKADLVEGLRNPGVGPKHGIFRWAWIQEWEIYVGPVKPVIELLYLGFDPIPAGSGIVKIQV